LNHFGRHEIIIFFVLFYRLVHFDLPSSGPAASPSMPPSQAANPRVGVQCVGAEHVDTVLRRVSVKANNSPSKFPSKNASPLCSNFLVSICAFSVPPFH
jgi:hypothetical protein